MKCRILHESRGRLRVHLMMNRMTMDQADILEYYLKDCVGIVSATVYDRTADAVICYDSDRADIIRILSEFSFATCEVTVPEHTGRALNREFSEKLIFTIIRRYLKRLLIPAPIRHIICLIKSVKYIFKAIRSLREGRLDVAVLDAVAIVVSLIRGDFSTASSVMFMLRIGEILEEWTHKKSVDDLARTMSLNVEKVWVQSEDGQEVLTSLSQVRAGDRIVVRTATMVPLDGVVVSGNATVNQASITGESLPVAKEEGSYVYAGTVVEEGEVVVQVDKVSGEGKYDRIVRMIEESEKLNSISEQKATSLADRLVPFSLGATALTWLITRNVTKALSILMVDFSCALKLTIPIAVLSAMRESSHHGISVKGGKYMEAVAKADTIVFDKTGTLTHASPKVADVIAFNGKRKKEMLRLAACLEEHYPHSIANAIVAEAKAQNLKHEEHHTSIEYIVAHGISSIDNGRKVVLGSSHFVFEDEGCVVPENQKDRLAAIPEQYSHIYMAIDGVLAAVICVEDPLRQEAREVVERLHEFGISKVIMMTGDSERTARAVAAEVGVDEYDSEVLPEDKAGFIKREHEAGRTVIMVGDGINDSPALSEADVGIAISDGAAIAREIADITISADDLYALLTLRLLSERLTKRIQGNYRTIVGFNLMLIILGVVGVLPPTTTALLHNVSTIAIALRSMTNLIDE